MKKIIVTALIAVMGFGAQAQLVSTTSAFEEVFKEKKVRVKPKMEWYVKAGLNLMSINWNKWPVSGFGYGTTISGGDKIKAGFNVAGGLISYFRPSNPSDFYWGLEVGLSQCGGGFDSMTDSANKDFNSYAKSGSFRFLSTYLDAGIGWKKSLAKNIKLDLHFSPELLMVFGDGGDFGYNVHTPWGDGTSYDTINSYLFNLALRGGVGIWFNKFNIDLSYRGTILFGDFNNGFNNILLSVGYAF